MKEIKSTITEIQEAFKSIAIEAHIFGSVARGDADLYSDLDVWLTFKDEDIKNVIAKRLDYYSQITEIIHIHEAPQNAPIGGIQSFVLYKIGDKLLRVDYSLCPQSSSFQTKDSKKLFGADLPVGELSLNPQKIAVDSNYRIDFVISFVFNSIKYLARKKQNPLQDLLREYDNLKDRYGIDIKPLLGREESIETLRQIIKNLDEVSNDKQKMTLSEISKFTFRVLP
jgi:predicted nucleotidyltransferase